MLKRIIRELKEHYPFTLFGALTGIILMMLTKGISYDIAYNFFYICHPLHIFLSAIVTTSIYKKYTDKYSKGRSQFLKVFIVGYTGSIFVGTLSDSLIPYCGEYLLGMHYEHAHIGFIEEWYIVNPAAIVAIIIAYFRTKTKLMHAGHVLISTWASLFHMIMASVAGTPVPYFGVFIFLFLAVWLPCCVSDIIFPMLFVRVPKAPLLSRKGKI